MGWGSPVLPEGLRGSGGGCWDPRVPNRPSPPCQGDACVRVCVCAAKVCRAVVCTLCACPAVHMDTGMHTRVQAVRGCLAEARRGLAGARALTGVEAHGHVQQVERIAKGIQAQPQRRVLLLQRREARPGGAGGVTGAGTAPTATRTPRPPAPHPPGHLQMRTIQL